MRTNLKSKIQSLTSICMLLILVACSDSKINNATIKIRPYNQNDRGKFWEICIDYDKSGFSELVAYFEIKSKNGIVKNYSVDFIHLKEKCNSLNILTYFTNRFTPNEEWEWLRTLDADNIDVVILRVKKNYNDTNYIFEKTFNTIDLKE